MQRMKRFYLQGNIVLAQLFSAVTAFAQTEPVQEASAQPQNIKEVAVMHADTAKNLIDTILEIMVKYSFQALGGVIVLFLGWLLGKYVGNWLGKLLARKKIDVTISKFIISAVKMLIIAFALIVALGKFGIEIAPLIAGISVAGFGLSFALQGPLSNYASGAVLIFTKPFKVGDIIEVADIQGEVVDMELPRTILKTIDGNSIFVPNKHIVGEIIHNYSELKRVDIKVGISYKSDVDKAIRIIKNVIKDDIRVAKEPNVGILEFGDSSVNLDARIWCKQDLYWNVLFDINKRIFDEFNKQGIEIPYPQRDVHIINKS